MEQLQQTLNKAIKMWYINIPFWLELKYINFLSYWDHWIYNTSEMTYISYHELFSKDSWLMEFMEWIKDKYCSLYEIVECSDDYWYSQKIRSDIIWVNYHYMMMWLMTAQEKINYFNTNAYLPETKKV